MAKPVTDNLPWNIWQQNEGVTRFNSAEGQAGRIISARLLPGCDFMQGIIDLAVQHQVQAAWVNGFGSLAKAAFSPLIRLCGDPADRVERQPNVELPGPLEMWTGMGRLGVPKQGEPFLHFHGMITTQDGQVLGGHFFPGGNTVYATFEVHIQEIIGTAFTYEPDPVVEIPLVEPVQL